MKLAIWPPLKVYYRDDTAQQAAEISEVDFPDLPGDKAAPDDGLVKSVHNRFYDDQLRRVPEALLRTLDLEAGLRAAFRDATNGALAFRGDRA